MNELLHLPLLVHPGTLWQRTIAQTEQALACGALLSIPTRHEFVEQSGVHFLVRIVNNLIRKEASDLKQRQEEKTGNPVNPFLPYERDLFVMDISETHVCLLNKFNVVDHHLLIVTRAFEEQESLLTLQDFTAMWACLSEVEGLAFYNAGKEAGASQRHKHLQLVPFPIEKEIHRLPIDPLIDNISNHDRITQIPEFPFVHALAKFEPETKPEDLLQYYYQLLETIGIRSNRVMQSAPYNLLATREWMLIVPRSQAGFNGIGVNSLAFAGALLVPNAEKLEILKQLRPLNFLKNVAMMSSIKTD
ncbi:MAG: phosphorylase [Leptolyngbya sp. Prado105]|jgi:ATP adenylyltransferase|nr:phosphorylase [Leptolyngbya sp. Prado105]